MKTGDIITDTMKTDQSWREQCKDHIDCECMDTCIYHPNNIKWSDQYVRKLQFDNRELKEAFKWSNELNSKLAHALDYAYQTLKGNDKQKELKIVSDEIAILMKDFSKYNP